MPIVTRVLNNAGSPVVNVAGTVLAGATVTFELVDPQGSVTDTFDSTTFERVYGSTSTVTNANGEFTISLWPNDRGTTSTMYKCLVNQSGVASVLGFVSTGVGVLTWFAFKITTNGYTPAQATELDNHVNNISNPHAVTKEQVGLDNADNTSDADKPISSATQSALDLKTTITTLAAVGGAALVGNTPAGDIAATTVQAAINELDTEKEATANKSTSVVTDQASNVKFPSVKAVYDWAVGLFVSKTSATGSAQLPSGTTVEGGTGASGYLRHDSTLDAITAWIGGAWATVATTANAVLTTGAQTIAGVKTFSSPVGVAAATASGDAVQLGQTLGRNVIINGGFTINQRAYVSGAALAAGSFGHDRWKAGAGGGDYSFTQLNSDTQITIAANKTLIHVVEDKNIQSTTYTLSWEGTAQARYAVNSATPAGAYAASPIVITGQAAGSTLSIEFGNGASSGTLSKVQLEAGSVATTFENRQVGAELLLCKRYFQTLLIGSGVASGRSNWAGYITFPVEMRATPTATCSGPIVCANGGSAFTGASATSITGSALGASFNTGGFASALVANAIYISDPASGVFKLSAEL